MQPALHARYFAIKNAMKITLLPLFALFLVSSLHAQIYVEGARLEPSNTDNTSKLIRSSARMDAVPSGLIMDKVIQRKTLSPM